MSVKSSTGTNGAARANWMMRRTRCTSRKRRLPSGNTRRKCTTYASCTSYGACAQREVSSRTVRYSGMLASRPSGMMASSSRCTMSGVSICSWDRRSAPSMPYACKRSASSARRHECVTRRRKRRTACTSARLVSARSMSASRTAQPPMPHTASSSARGRRTVGRPWTTPWP